MWGLELLPEVQQALAGATVMLAIPWAAIAMALGMGANAWSSSRQSNREDEREDSQRDYEHQLGLQRRLAQMGILRPMWEKHGLPARSDADWEQWASIPAPPSTPGRGFDWQGLVGGLASGAGMGLAAESAGQQVPQSTPGQVELPEWLREWLKIRDYQPEENFGR